MLGGPDPEPRQTPPCGSGQSPATLPWCRRRSALALSVNLLPTRPAIDAGDHCGGSQKQSGRSSAAWISLASNGIVPCSGPILPAGPILPMGQILLEAWLAGDAALPLTPALQGHRTRASRPMSAVPRPETWLSWPINASTPGF
jgi:hypothetical protein